MTKPFEPHPLYKVAEVELIFHRDKNAIHPKITSSQCVHKILMAAWDMNRIDLVEEFKIVLVDRKSACIGISHIGIGGTAACVVDPKIIFAIALKSNAAGIALAHNHPSRNLRPSQNDIDLTKKLAAAGKVLDIQVLDHLIVSSDGYYSFMQEGLMPG